MTDEELKRIEGRCDHNDKEDYMASCWDLTGDARALIREVRRLHGECAAIVTSWVPMETARKAAADSAAAHMSALAKMFRAKGHIGAAEDVEQVLRATQSTAPSAPTVKCRTCMDLRSVIDHARSSVAVMVRVPCPDCAPSPTVPATCATCGGTGWSSSEPFLRDRVPCRDCAGRAK